MQNLKIVFVGDGAVGKSCFLTQYRTNTFPQEYIPLIWENYIHDVMVDGEPLSLDLCYTAGQEDYDRLRPLAYPQTDVLLIVFSVVSRTSFENVRDKWEPEVRHFCPNIPILLLGLKCDLRGKADRYRGQSEVSVEEAIKFAKKMGFVGYYETSALKGVGVHEAMDACVRAALRAKRAASPNRRRRWRFSFRSRDTDQFSTNTPLIPPPPELPATEKSPSTNIPPSTFASDWAKMVDNPSHSDVVLKLSGKMFHAHLYVLASGSYLFRQLFGVSEVESLAEGWSKKQLRKVTRERVNEGQVEGLLHMEERVNVDGCQVTELTFDPNFVSEVALSRALAFLYSGVMELNKDSEGLEETTKILQVLNVPALINACERKKPVNMAWLNRNADVAKKLFLNKPLFSDVSFRVEGQVVHAHRLVLCTRCEVMAAMLSGAFSESQAREIDIPDVSLDTFMAFLEYLYTDHCPIEDGNSIGIMELANRYVMGRLMNLCELYISKHVEKITVDCIIAEADVDIIDLLLTAQLHNAAQLSSWCLHFISSNFVVFENKGDITRLSDSNLSYVEEHR